MLDDESFWDFQTQVDVVLVCCIIHNFLRGIDLNDQIMREIDQEFSSNALRQRMSQREERRKSRLKTKRDAIANAMWQEYQARGVSSLNFMEFLISIAVFVVPHNVYCLL